MSVLLYSFGIGAYGTAIRLAAPFNRKAKLFVQGRNNLEHRITAAFETETRPRIWMHCSSLGEFEQGRPVLEALRERHPECAFVLTFFSPSGYEVRKNYKGADYVFYLPLDTRHNAQWFLDAVQPKIALFVKYDLWYHLLQELKACNVITILFSAIFQPGQRFFKPSGGIYRTMLQCFSRIFVQNKTSKELLENIGIQNCTVSGDTRFDRVVAAVAEQKALLQAEAFAANHFTLIAGSTWEDDEKLLHTVFEQLPDNFRLILAPHEVHEEHIQQIEKRFTGSCVRWSQWKDSSDARVLIVDSIGLLLYLYRYGRAAWIGGGFNKSGIHNMPEAAVYGIPCLCGPNYDRFLEAKELIAQGGAFSMQEATAIANQLKDWAENEEARRKAGSVAENYIRQRAGATGEIVNYLEAKNWSITP